MKLNLKFYKGKDEYSDGSIEDKIIELIKKYPNDYEKAFLEDSSWPVFYHLSEVRKNSISWYPFKDDSSILEVGGGMGALTSELCKKCNKVTTVELSKKRATAILERNKNAENLEIIVGNFKDIILSDKYDYILLNGVLEYGALYMDSDNPYEDFINKLKENLKPNGKILIAIENRFGIKYWCGSNEDHTGKMYDGINGYLDNAAIRTFSKHELEALATKCGMNINFYYMFPDYKFPKIIYTDKSLDKNIYSKYIPYYSSNMNLLIDEERVYKDIFDNKVIPFFANSYFIELSYEKNDIEIEYVKYNNEFRKSAFDIFTYLKDGKFYKKCGSELSKSQVKNIYDIYKLVNSCDIDVVETFYEDSQVYSLTANGENLINLMKDEYQNGNVDMIIDIYDKIYDIIKKIGEPIELPTDNIFTKYGVLVSDEYLQSMEFYSKGLIDAIPSNFIVVDDNYVMIDQEWVEDNVPIQYIMYRAITDFIKTIDKDSYNLKEKLYEKYNINEKIFNELNKNFLDNIKNDSFELYYDYYLNHKFVKNPNNIFNNASDKDLNKMFDEINRLNNLISEISKKNQHLSSELSNIYNSKSWKLIDKLRIKKKN